MCKSKDNEQAPLTSVPIMLLERGSLADWDECDALKLSVWSTVTAMLGMGDKPSGYALLAPGPECCDEDKRRRSGGRWRIGGSRQY